jgi:EmrB/QacA subfamily drug resistance transporter
VDEAKPAVVFAIVAVGVALATLDQFIVNIAFSSIERGFHSSLSTLSWVLNAYSIVFAALLVPAGRLADRSGRKRGFLIGVVIFTVASALCAAAPNVEWLISARVIQAVGAALLMPSSLGLLLAAFPPEKRAAAVRGWTAVTGASAALGPVVGGLLTSASWRWIFLINVPLGIAALVAGRRALPDVRPEPSPLPDLAGAALLAGAIGAVSLGLVEAHGWGYGSWRFVSTVAGAAVLLAWFLRRSARHPSPVVELRLLGLRRFRLAGAATLIYSAGFAAMLLSSILWTQTSWHWGSLRSGLALAPGPLMVPIFSILSARLIARIGAGATAVVGCAVFASGSAYWIARVGETPHYVSALLPGMVLTGIGVGLTLPTLIAIGSTALPPERFATGSGVLTMARQVGFTLGVAVVVAILASPTAHAAHLDSFRRAWIAIVALSVVAAAVSALLLERREVELAPGPGVPEPAPAEQ